MLIYIHTYIADSGQVPVGEFIEYVEAVREEKLIAEYKVGGHHDIISHTSTAAVFIRLRFLLFSPFQSTRPLLLSVQRNTP